MIIDLTNFLTQMLGLSKLAILTWARQVVNLFHNRINLREWVVLPGSDEHERIQ
jgi:hypothetical protein